MATAGITFDNVLLGFGIDSAYFLVKYIDMYHKDLAISHRDKINHEIKMAMDFNVMDSQDARLNCLHKKCYRVILCLLLCSSYF